MQSELERKVFELLTHGYPAPFARVADLSKRISELFGQYPAALSDQERAGEVKRLEWKKTALSDNYTWLTIAIAETPFGRYAVDKHDNGYLRLLFGGAEVWTSDDGNKDGAIAAAEAKAAAQADYEQRIRSALVDVPVEPDTVFASRHNDEIGECETVEIEPVKVRQLREKIAANLPHREGGDSAEVKRRFHVEWSAGARPPVHPEPMAGRTTFDTFDEAISHMRRQAEDAAFISLEERITTTVSVDRSADARAALAATRSASVTSSSGGAE